MSSAYIGNQLNMDTALLGGVLALGMAPFVLLALPTALLGRAILNEIRECKRESRSDSILEHRNEQAPFPALRLGEAVREQIQTLLDGEREKIHAIKNVSVQKSLMAIEEQLQADCQEQLTTGNIRDLDVLFRELRVKISEAQIEERSWLLSLKDFNDRCRAAQKKVSPEKALQLEQLQKQAEELSPLPFDERFSRLMEMTGLLCSFAEQSSKKINQKSKEIHEILDCAARIAQIDPQEREKLLPLLDELEHPSPFESRISMIHRQVRLTYAAVRERAAQTISFKEELSPLLPLISLIPASSWGGGVFQAAYGGNHRRGNPASRQLRTGSGDSRSNGGEQQWAHRSAATLCLTHERSVRKGHGALFLPTIPPLSECHA